jgi:hypothetical protein
MESPLEARRKLTLGERRLVYGIARDCYIRNPSDGEQFKIDFENHPDAVGFSPILIQIAIELAIILFRWWVENHLTIPSVVPSASDPGFFDADEVLT